MKIKYLNHIDNKDSNKLILYIITLNETNSKYNGFFLAIIENMSILSEMGYKVYFYNTFRNVVLDTDWIDILDTIYFINDIKLYINFKGYKLSLANFPCKTLINLVNKYKCLQETIIMHDHDDILRNTDCELNSNMKFILQKINHKYLVISNKFNDILYQKLNYNTVSLELSLIFVSQFNISINEKMDKIGYLKYIDGMNNNFICCNGKVSDVYKKMNSCKYFCHLEKFNKFDKKFKIIGEGFGRQVIEACLSQCIVFFYPNYFYNKLPFNKFLYVENIGQVLKKIKIIEQNKSLEKELLQNCINVGKYYNDKDMTKKNILKIYNIN